jgi:ATP-dependent DNA helicase RecQ
LDRYRQLLLKHWGYSSFRPLQEDIIRSVSEKKDTLALMPTGGGKSITFQVPVLAEEGICIVITPLIALMKDQVEALIKKNIKALAIYSGLSQEEIDIALDNCIYGDYKFLYCSPERLGTELFRSRVLKMKVSLIAVDEAHCISQWGYDFRPSYLKIAELRKLLPEVPVLALTATATPVVVDDIQEKLGFTQKNVFQMSFERKNLVYTVRETEDKLNQLLKIINSVPGTGIVYVRNRQKTKEITQSLLKNNVQADYYHAGLTDEVRTQKQVKWMKGKTRIIVATNAFGMGIDKPDVRLVIHADLPDSPEAYFQEAGRGGRDGKKAYAVLLYNNADKLSAEKRIETNFPDIKIIKNVYNALGNYLQLPYGAGKYQAYDFNLVEFSMNYKFNINSAYSSLKILEQEGYIEVTDDLNNPAKVHFLINRDDLYKFQVTNAAFDTFIKLLLRSYEGLFTNYVGIDEKLLAKRANTSIENIYKYLNKLSSAGIMHYIPRKKNPVVVFTEERLDDKALRITYDEYTSRRNRYVEKLEAMLNYASSSNKCRSQILLAYFGEKDPYRCGQCDVCLRRNELDISKYEFDIMLEEFKKELHEKSVPLQELVDKHAQRFSEEKLMKVIRWLLDNGKINYDNENKLVWSKK